MDNADGELQTIWSELEVVAQPARERRRLDPAIFANLVIALCTRAPLSVRDLSLLLERSEAYVGDAIRPLVASGRIQFLFPDQPKHPRQKYTAIAAVPDLDSPDMSTSAPIDAEAYDDVVRPTPLQPQALQPRRTLETRDQTYGIDHGAETIERAPEFSERPLPSSRRKSTGWGSPGASVVMATFAGVALGFIGGNSWLLYAILLALAFAVTHVATQSQQYMLYATHVNLRPSGPRLYDTALFVLAKAAFSLIEILVVVFVISRLRGH